MADVLESIPDDPGALYDYRDPQHIPLWLPYHQGDVFSDVELPAVLGGGTGYAMLFMHPCTMREGASLRELQTVIAVNPQSTRKILAPRHWLRWFKVMPLPDLMDNKRSTYAGDFMSIWTVSSAELPRYHRVAQLSHTGRLILQQRLIFHLVRYAPDLREVERASLPVSDEIVLQSDWVATGLRALGEPESNMDAIVQLEGLFDEFMGYRPNGSAHSLREMLSSDDERRQAHTMVSARIARFSQDAGTPPT